jgi:hypothetical protein
MAGNSWLTLVSESRQSLLARAQVFAVHHFQANVTLTRIDEPTIKVAGKLTASVSARQLFWRACVLWMGLRR